MLSKASRGSLVLIDEIIVGTNPRQGAAIAQAILEEMARNGSRVIVTTHYSELKELASSNSAFRNASVSFDLDTLRPTYKLIMGLAGVSYAVEIAENYGLQSSILSRAIELIDERELSVEAILEETQRFKQEMEEERAALDLQREELRKENERVKEQQRKLALLSHEIKEGRGIELLAELDAMRKQAAERIRLLQVSNMKEAADIQGAIASLRGEAADMLRKERDEHAAGENTPGDPAAAKPGDRVYAASIEKEGIIDSISRDLSSAVVLFGGTIRARFPFASLYNLVSEKPAGKKPASGVVTTPDAGGGIPGTVQTSYNTIDLRGSHVPDALAALDSGLDSMLKNNIPIVIVIHGHGTGALKQAVRENLKMSVYVSDFRQGDYGEGGDGVTVVKMRQ
jgi:DNA mismatch repair protein MutS2